MLRQGLGKAQILRRPQDFQRIFRKARYRSASEEFLLLAVDSHCPHARLGIVIAKRNVRLASQRNRIRRQVKEFFRRQNNPALDIVVLARSKSAAQTSNHAIRMRLRQLWPELLKARQRKNSSA